MFKSNAFRWLSWIFSICSVIYLSIDLILNAPTPDFGPLLLENSKKSELHVNEHCCIATTFDSSSFKNVHMLGYTLNSVGVTPPKSFAFYRNNVGKEDKETLEKYFNVVTSDSNATFDYLESCFPLITVSPKGVFNKSPWDICNYAKKDNLPAAVPQVDDILYPDTSMIVSDPKNSTGSVFKNSLEKWKVLPSNFSVMDFDNDFLDFWTAWSTPTYVHYTDETYRNLEKGVKNSESGSFMIYRMLKLIYNDFKNSLSNK